MGYGPYQLGSGIRGFEIVHLVQMIWRLIMNRPAIIGCEVLNMYLKCNVYNKIEMETKGEQCKIVQLASKVCLQ